VKIKGVEQHQPNQLFRKLVRPVVVRAVGDDDRQLDELEQQYGNRIGAVFFVQVHRLPSQIFSIILILLLYHLELRLYLPDHFLGLGGLDGKRQQDELDHYGNGDDSQPHITARYNINEKNQTVINRIEK
jgi:hypothetical protein